MIFAWKPNLKFCGTFLSHLSLSMCIFIVGCDDNNASADKNRSNPTIKSPGATFASPEIKGDNKIWLANSVRPPVSEGNDAWRNKGDGKDRIHLLTEQVKEFSAGELGEWLIKNAKDLTDQDEAFYIRFGAQLSNVPVGSLTKAINASTSPELKKRLLAAVSEQTSGKITPVELFNIAETIQPAKERNQLVKDSLEEWLRSNPAYAISSAGKALEVVRGGNADAASAYTELAPVFKKIPKERRDEVWNLLPTADSSMRNSIVFRLVEGQYRNDSLDASQWIDTLPTGELKSSAVRALVAQLVSDGDLESAGVWASSAAKYLTPSDSRNIRELMERSQ